MTRPLPGPDAGTGGLPVLTFHSFGASRGPTSCDPSWFAETLAMLAEAGFRCVDLSDWVARGRPDEPRGYALAFDDGLRSLLRVADTLARHHATATVFLVSDRVGTDNAWPGQPSWVPVERLLTWDEIAALAGTGMTFASHGASHARLDRCTLPRLAAELRGSRDAIEDRTGRPCRLVAYPYGSDSDAVRRRAASVFAAGFGTRLDFADSRQPAFGLSRLDAYYARSPRLRAALLTGKAQKLLAWRRALRTVRRNAAAVRTALVASRPQPGSV